MSLQWARSRERLWNTAERAEKRHNSRLAREYQVMLPVELDAPRRVALARAFAREIAERYKVAVDLAVHEPRPDADPRNFHAHLLTTTREVTPAGLGAKAGLDMHARERRRHGLPDHSQEFTNVRERWATLTNDALRDANIDARIDHRSLAAQGIDRVPQPAIPLMHLKMEQRGLKSGLADRLRAEYRDRIAFRLEKAAAREAAATALDGRGISESRAAPGVAGSDVEEVKRRAREAWLQFRSGAQQTGNAQASAKGLADERDAREDDAAESRPQNDLAL
jgi:ATP-dependent exoDNAse (exonuclease V) alpha subunit